MVGFSLFFLILHKNSAQTMEYLIADFKINCPKPLAQTARDLLADAAGAAGFEAFEDTDDGLKGYVQKTAFDQNALDASLSSIPLPNTSVTYTVTEAENKDWNELWELEGFEPIRLTRSLSTKGGGDETPAITIAAYKGQKPSMGEILIDARQAFGTGTHQTTQMIVESLLSLNVKGKRVLDCGCGTGILSIAAVKLGASEAVGYDIDEWSVENTKHNADINGVAGQIHAFQGDASIVATLNGCFDIVLANINRNIILHDMAAMTRPLTDNGTFIISGFYGDDVPLLQQKASKLKLSLVGRQSKGEWTCLMFRK